MQFQMAGQIQNNALEQLSTTLPSINVGKLANERLRSNLGSTVLVAMPAFLLGMYLAQALITNRIGIFAYMQEASSMLFVLYSLLAAPMFLYLCSNKGKLGSAVSNAMIVSMMGLLFSLSIT